LESIKNPAVQGLADRVFVTVDKTRDKYYPSQRGAEVRVTTKRGIFTSEVGIPKGDPENPFTFAELKEKFMSNASRVLSRDVATEIEALVMGDGSSPVTEIMRLVSSVH
jgi:2-methylcitrate dehydratase PrpD